MQIRRDIAPIAMAAAALVGQQVAMKAARDALFLSQFPVRLLPTAMAVGAALSLVSVLAFARAMARRPPAAVVPAALLLSAVLLVAEWGICVLAPRAAALLVYAHMAVFGATLVSAFWSLVGERFDPHTAKTAMAPIGAAANVGAVLGGLLAWQAASRVGVRDMLLVLAALTALSWWGVLRMRAGAAEGSRPPKADDDADVRSGLAVLREAPFLRAMALVVGVGAFVEALLEYMLSAAAVSRLHTGPRLMAFFAMFHTSAAVAALLLQATVATPALRQLGLAGTVALRPAAAAVGALGVWLAPGLLAAVAARGADAVLRNSLFRAGYELLYTPVPPRHKRPLKTLVDVGMDRLGTIAGSLALLALVAAAPNAPAVVPAVCAFAAVATALLTLRLQTGYVAALADSLRTGAVRLDPHEAVDGITRLTIIESQVGLDRRSLLRDIEEHRRAEAAAGGAGTGDAVLAAVADLRSGDPARIERALARGVDPALAGHVIPLLARDDLARVVQKWLQAVAGAVTGQLVDALLAQAQAAAVRRRIPPILATVASRRAVDGLLAALRDPAFEVRARSARALDAILDGPGGLSVPRDAALEAARAELGLPDQEGRRLRLVFLVLGLVTDRDAMRLAYRAVQSGDPGLRGTALEYLENVVPDHVRVPLWQRLGVTAPPRPLTSRVREDPRDALLRTAIHLPGGEPEDI